MSFAERPGPQSDEPQGLHAGHGRSPERITPQPLREGAVPPGDPIEQWRQDVDVARVVAAVLAVMEPMLKPTGWSPQRDNIAQLMRVQSVAFGAAGVLQLVGQDWDRRRVSVLASAAGVQIGPDRNTVENRVGWDLQANLPMSLDYVGELWCSATGAVTVKALIVAGETRNVPHLGSIAGDAPLDAQGPAHKGHVR